MGPGPGCSALTTELAHSELESDASLPEIKAYKLGKKRWSYNQVELHLSEAGGTRTCAVKHAVHAAGAVFPEACRDSAACFQVHLESGAQLEAHIFAVYGEAQPCGANPPAPSHTEQQQQQQQQQRDGGSSAAGPTQFAWRLVTRRACCRGCQGNVLRPVQRYGRLGKRSWTDSDDSEADPAAGTKAPKHMYISVDEACSHVGTSAFRLMAALYDAEGESLLATAVSPPIRVLANNDVPTGAARIPLHVALPSDWDGWDAAPRAEQAGGSDASLQRGKRQRSTPRCNSGAPARQASTSGSDLSAPPQAQRSADTWATAAAEQQQATKPAAVTPLKAAAAADERAASPRVIPAGPLARLAASPATAAAALAHSQPLPCTPPGRHVLLVPESPWQAGVQQAAAQHVVTTGATAAFTGGDYGSSYLLASRPSLGCPSAGFGGGALSLPDTSPMLSLAESWIAGQSGGPATPVQAAQPSSLAGFRPPSQPHFCSSVPTCPQESISQRSSAACAGYRCVDLRPCCTHTAASQVAAQHSASVSPPALGTADWGLPPAISSAQLLAAGVEAQRCAMMLQRVEARVVAAGRAATSHAYSQLPYLTAALQRGLAAPVAAQRSLQAQLAAASALQSGPPQLPLAPPLLAVQPASPHTHASTDSACVPAPHVRGGAAVTAPSPALQLEAGLEGVPADLEGMLALDSVPDIGFGSLLGGSIFDDVLGDLPFE